MNAQKTIEPDDKEQSQRFIDTAKELGADENNEAFERALGILPTKTGNTLLIPKVDQESD